MRYGDVTGGEFSFRKTDDGGVDDTWNKDGSMRCNLCGKEPCVCGTPTPGPPSSLSAEALAARLEREYQRICGRSMLQRIDNTLAAALRAGARAIRRVEKLEAVMRNIEVMAMNSFSDGWWQCMVCEAVAPVWRDIVHSPACPVIDARRALAAEGEEG